MRMRLNLSNLIFTQQEIDKEGVEFYDKKIKHKEKIDPIKVKYCKHTKQYYATDGHHKSYSLFFNNNTETAICDVKSCKHFDTKKPKFVPPCSIKEEYYAFNGTIHDLKVMSQEDYNKLEQQE